MTDHAVRPARARDLPLIAAIEDAGLRPGPVRPGDAVVVVRPSLDTAT